MPAKTTIDQIMTKGVFTVDLEDTVNKADQIMREQHVRHVPVLEDSKFIGMITEKSLMEYTLRQIYDYDDKLEEVGKNKIIDFQNIMTKDVHLIYPEDTIMKAVQVMAKYKVDYLPVVDWTKDLVGLVTTLDLLLFFNKKLKEEN
ncbi:MAG: CBS domain-containing protein [FCB group bacterium]|jgi:CBS domain-containing protein